MKKILSLALVGLMMVSVLPVAYAASISEPIEHFVGCEYYGQSILCDTCGEAYCPAGCTIMHDCSGNEGSTIPEVGTTTVTLVGSEESVGSYYEVEVPASMIRGGNADITVEGNWKSTETLKVSAPEKVTLYYGDQSMDVAIEFDSIAQVGNDKVGSTATANLKIADASVKFGTWTGVIEYTVELAETSTDSGSGYPGIDSGTND